jgi:hypothetical protein
MLAQSEKAMSSLRLERSTPSSSRRWVIDSGAELHLCYNKELLTDFKDYNPPRQTQGVASEFLEITGCGTATIATSSGTNLVLTNVDYAPGGPKGGGDNLISTSQLFDSLGCAVTFYGDICSIAKVFEWGPENAHHLVPVWSGTRINRTYWLDEQDEKTKQSAKIEQSEKGRK